MLLHRKMAGRVPAIFLCWWEQPIRNGSLIGCTCSRLPDPIRERAIQIEVKRSAPAAQNARTQTKRTLSQRRPGNNRRLPRSSLQKRSASDTRRK